jgi:hypothetical protein
MTSLYLNPAWSAPIAIFINRILSGYFAERLIITGIARWLKKFLLH